MIPNFYSPQRSTRTDLFDLLPSIAAEAAYAIHAKTDGVDEGLIQAQLIAVMAAAVAPHFTLTLPNWKPIPLGIPVICIGRSGVSKTPVYLEVSPAAQGVRGRAGAAVHGRGQEPSRRRGASRVSRR